MPRAVMSTSRCNNRSRRRCPTVRLVPGGAGTYPANDASVGDLDGDGDFEIVLKWEPSNAKDNSHSGFTGTVFLDAYELDGTRLWRIDLGRNIRAGAHYTQFMVYDLDGDGRAEVTAKTADGTVDGNEDTRSERYLAAVAYLDGRHPSVVMCRGYYTRSVLAAFDWDGKRLTSRWVFDTDSARWASYAGQGNHNLRVADVDGDGCDEITYGSCAIDHDGTGLYNTGFGHGDALHLTAFDPSSDRFDP